MMFEKLGDRLKSTFKNLTGKGRLTEDNIKDAMREVRVALLEADVALPVVRTFVDRVRERAVGKDVAESLNPGQAVIKIVNDELVALMGTQNDRLNLSTRPPAVVLVAGLQGAGKTTTIGKLAKFLIEREKKSVMMVSADIYRPAAIEQLQRLAETTGAKFFPSSSDQDPVSIVRAAHEQATKSLVDVLLVDTAGRLHVDSDLMDEVQKIHAAVDPIETLFVVDSMTGQDAVISAKAFDESLPLTGIILTKTDGDARGGAALSIREVTGKPIKFMGVGEAMDALEAFHPDRVASRILGMGDVLTLVEEIEQKVDKDKAEKLATKFKKGKGFDLEDFKEQMQQMEQMGGIASMIDKIPGAGNIPKNVLDQAGDKQSKQVVAIINSMTTHERSFPAVIKGSRKKRIALGSGTQIQDVNRLLKQFAQMQKMMKKMGKKKNMMRMLSGMGGMGGRGGGGGFPGMPFK
ncbi:MAG: signal recognition particle subunit SRP54 [Gammaproteobacteria bacterium]|jgi:signal recognition particle subunit SRP54